LLQVTEQVRQKSGNSVLLSLSFTPSRGRLSNFSNVPAFETLPVAFYGDFWQEDTLSMSWGHGESAQATQSSVTEVDSYSGLRAAA
jgi:hypothetical protein